MEDLKEIRWDYRLNCFVDDERNKLNAAPIGTPKVFREGVEMTFLESYAKEMRANAYCEGSCLEFDRAWDAPVSISRIPYQFYRIK